MQTQGSIVKFGGLKLFWNAETFIPKKQTKYLVTNVLKRLDTNRQVNIIDICSGIGNITIALALKLPRANIFGTDICQKSIAAASMNATHYQLGHRVSFFTGDLLEPLRNTHLIGNTDAVICNPPYIPSFMIKNNLVKEPRIAIDGGLTGFRYYKQVIYDVADFLKPGGLLAFECGSKKQGQGLSELIKMSGHYSKAEIIPIRNMNEVNVLVCRNRTRHRAVGTL